MAVEELLPPVGVEDGFVAPALVGDLAGVVFVVVVVAVAEAAAASLLLSVVALAVAVAGDMLLAVLSIDQAMIKEYDVAGLMIALMSTV